MSEEPAASKADERARLRREREHLRRLRINEAGVALAALLLSATVIGVNAYNHRRGSQMVVLQPGDVVFYRDQGPNSAALWLAVPVQMVNASRDYGDVVIRASAAVGQEQDTVGFQLTSLVEPTMSTNAEAAAAACPHGARCLAVTGFYVVERPKRLLDVPGGSSRSEYMGFQLERPYCVQQDIDCDRFQDFDSALAALRAMDDPDIKLDVRFHFDGERRVVCNLTDDNVQRGRIFDYLADKGWAQVLCETES